MESSRYIPIAIQREILSRANFKCECCGTAITLDKHHIVEYSKGGAHSVENLIAVCPTCHRQLPLYLSEQQQKDIFTIISERREVNYPFSSQSNAFLIGSNSYVGASAILAIEGQNVISVAEVDGKFYPNIIMLGPIFSQNVLILGNRVIYPASNSELITDESSLRVSIQGSPLLELFKGENGVMKANLNFSYKNQQYIYNEKETIIPGSNIFTGCTFNMRGGVAISIE